MTSTQTILLEDARRTLTQFVTAPPEPQPLDILFMRWLVPDLISEERVVAAISHASTATGAERTYKQIAVLGFAIQVANLTDEQASAFHDGVCVVSGREPVVDGTPMGFATDGVALLGIALGARTVTRGMEIVRDWIEHCMDTAQSSSAVAWQRCLITTAFNLCHPESERDILDDPEVADTLVMLCAKGLLERDPRQAETDERTALLQFLNEYSPTLPRLRAAIRLCSLDYIRGKTPTIALNHIGAEDVGDLLRRVSAGLRKWTWEDKPRTNRKGAQARKWHVDNEYHVQNLLWLALAPLFPDLSEEEYTPKIGTLQPRADICIPSLRLIVEVKFWRRGISSQEIIRQLAQDNSLYHVQGSGYDKLIAFIWDDARRSEQHDMLIQGLTALSEVVDAIVVSRPGLMSESEEKDEANETVK